MAGLDIPCCVRWEAKPRSFSPKHQDLPQSVKDFQNKQSISVKKRNPSFCNLSKFYEKIPEWILKDTVLDRYFNHINVVFYQNQRWVAGPSKENNGLLWKCSTFEIWKHSSIYAPGRSVWIKRNARLSTRSLFNNIKATDQASKFLETDISKTDCLCRIKRQYL